MYIRAFPIVITLDKKRVAPANPATRPIVITAESMNSLISRRRRQAS
jgi:hypothetical protein